MLFVDYNAANVIVLTLTKAFARFLSLRRDYERLFRCLPVLGQRFIFRLMMY